VPQHVTAERSLPNRTRVPVLAACPNTGADSAQHSAKSRLAKRQCGARLLRCERPGESAAMRVTPWCLHCVSSTEEQRTKLVVSYTNSNNACNMHVSAGRGQLACRAGRARRRAGRRRQALCRAGGAAAAPGRACRRRMSGGAPVRAAQHGALEGRARMHAVLARLHATA